MVQLPLRIWRGQTRVFRFTVFDVAADAPTSLTDYNDIEFQVKTETGAADPPLIAKAVGSGVEVLEQSGDTLGQLTVTIDPADTAGDGTELAPGLSPAVYAYDLWGIIGDNRYLLAAPSDFTVEGVVNDAA